MKAAMFMLVVYWLLAELWLWLKKKHNIADSVGNDETLFR